MPPSSRALENALVNRAWIQWVALGVDAVGEIDDAVVDPEALIALTAELGDADARLRDVSTDWCVAFGRYVNGSRLRGVVGELQTPADLIGEFVATVAAAGGPRWPMGTQPRPGYESRGKARLSSAGSRARLRIRLRAAFGVNARADILAALLSARSLEMNLADLARATRFSKLNVSSAVDALTLAGLIESRPVGNERRVRLAPVDALPGLRAPVKQRDWVATFGVALEVLRFEGRAVGSSSVRAIEARRLIERLRPSIASAGLPEPNLRAFGDEFGAAFDRWIVDLVYQLRLPGLASEA